MAGRRTTPLFDLLSRSQASSPPPSTPRESKPVVRVELKPREPSYAPEPAPAPERVIRVNGKAYPAWVKSVVFVGLALALITAWSLGSWVGQKRAEKDLANTVRRDPPVIEEPTDLGGATLSSAPVNVPAGTQPSSNTTARPLPPATGGDPREAGKNYLYLANLPKDDAARAVTFLRDHGVNAHSLPVESGAGGANNAGPGLYRVFVADGLTREEYSQSIRTKMEAEVVRLGAIWQREHRGGSNFARFGWEKYQ